MKFVGHLKQVVNPLSFVLQLVPAAGRLVVLLAAGLLSAVLFFAFNDSLQILEERLGALGWTLTTNDNLEQSITLVVIDEQSLAEIGPWPWPRQEMARLVSAIDAAGAQLQVHDIFYSDPKSGDAELLAALQVTQGAVLAQVPILQSEQAIQVGAMSHPVSGVGCNASDTASTGSYIASHSGFSAIPKGHITPNIASDGSIRDFPALICVDGSAYPALSISTLLTAAGSQDWGATISEGTSLFGSALRLQLDGYPGLNIPLDREGNLRISYKEAPTNFRAISAADVISGNIEPGMLENTWALVGATAISMGDVVPTPYSGTTPGIELQARILSSLLDAQIPYTPRSANWLLGLLTLIFVVLLLKLAAAPGRISAYGLPAAGLFLPLGALAIHVQLLSSSEIWLGWVYPALFGLLAASFLLLLEQSRVRVERSRVYGNLSSYLPSNIAKEIAYNLPSSAINAKRCDVTLLSADIRNFAAFGEARPPEESAAVLHYFFVRATEIVEQFGGRVHEFKGDSLLAVWDSGQQQAAEQSFLAAQEIQRAVDQKLMSPNSSNGLEPLALGIGIEQGPALIGSIGPAHRRSHALLGDTVTITLRIQELTEELAQPILVGECAARHLLDQKLESQGSFLLTGLKIPHTLFAPAFIKTPSLQKRNQQPNLKVVSTSTQ